MERNPRGRLIGQQKRNTQHQQKVAKYFLKFTASLGKLKCYKNNCPINGPRKSQGLLKVLHFLRNILNF
jgi:hypothetical protein